MLLFLAILFFTAAIVCFYIAIKEYSCCAIVLGIALIISSFICISSGFSFKSNIADLHIEYASITKEAQFLDSLNDDSFAIAYQKYNLNERIENYNSKYLEYLMTYTENRFWFAGWQVDSIEDLTTIQKLIT